MFQYKLPSVSAAFNAYIDTDIPNVTASVRHIKDFTLHRDQYDRYPALRSMTTVINWKSNVNNADATYNFRAKHEATLHRGDLMYDPAQQTIGMITWNVDHVVDCKKTQITKCNAWVRIVRHVPETVDNQTGYLIEPEHDECVVGTMPCVYAEMYGRYDYGVENNAPGILPDHTIEVKLQFNPETHGLRSGDKFTVKGIPHRVMIVDRSQINLEETHGVIMLICERMAP